MSPDECFWIGAKGGLVREKHRRCMGDAVWFFLWCLLRQTGVSESGEGIVNYGHPMTRLEIESITGFPEWQIKKWVDRLRRTEYLRTEQVHQKGIVIFVQKAKDKTKRAGANQDRLNALAGANQDRRSHTAPTKTIENKEVTSTQRVSITKDLPYYNKDAATTAVAVIRSLSKQVEIPKQKSWEQQKAELRQKGLL